MTKEREISDNEYYILNALANVPLHGYAIRQAVEKMTAGKKRLSLATLYDSLHRLLQDGFIESDGDKQVEGRIRRNYRINGFGKRALIDRYRMMELLQGISQFRIAEGDA